MSAPEELRHLNHLLGTLWSQPGFYREKWRRAGLEVHSLHALDELNQFPFTTRAELVSDQNTTPPWGTNLTTVPSELKRVHRTAGTTLSTLFGADSTVSWGLALDDARELLQIAGVGADDGVFVLLPFGPALVPWLMYEAALGLGCMALTVGDADPTIQLTFLRHFRPSVIVTRSSRLVGLAQAAREFGIPLSDLGVERIITTGHLGSSDAVTAGRLREQWPAEYFDSYLLTEVGAVAGECTAHPGGMHLLERSVLAEVVHPETGARMPEGEPGELVLTTLRRHTQPLVRYRTGDLARLRHHACACGLSGPMLFGGVRRREM